MVSWLQRFLFALGGATVGAALVALVEARAAQTGGGASYLDVFVGDLGVLGPLALVIGFAVAVATLFLEPERMRTLGDRVRALRAQPVLLRSRTAAMAPLCVVGTFLWCVAIANLARHSLAEGEPPVAGLVLGAKALGALVVLLACGLALLPPLRRSLAALAAGSQSRPLLVDPVVTGGLGVLVAGAAFGVGLALGDESGGGPTPLAIFGVLKRNELDLRPVVNLLAIAGCAYLVPMAFSNWRRASIPAAVALVVVLGSLFLTYREARVLNVKLAIANAIEANAPLGKVALALDRRFTDRDRDGYSPLFGGGDCNDNDPTINPGAIAIPGEGIDRDCSGEIAPAVAPILPDPAASIAASSSGPDAGALPPAPAKKTIDRDLNVVFITVDTLRPDVGFMGYTTDVGSPTPNLDRLAQKSVVFDRAYSMASYTGKALAPILIGRYPSETFRDGGHFNRYFDNNTFVAQRLQKAGIRTFGAGTHWYFAPSWGLARGMDVWDTGAIPSAGQGQEDTSVTSPQLTDVAIKLLSAKANTGGRFFAWFHYFDPHAQYVPHGDAPKFPLGGNQVSAMRAYYDGEVWFTDKHVGRLIDFIAQQPWGENTAIVLTSDHGEAFLEHKMAFHGIEIWEELVRVPLMIYVPGATPHHVPPKRSHIDIVPTLLELMRLPNPGPAELSGQSLVPEVLGSEGDAFEERDVLIDMPDGPNTKFRRAILYGPTPGMKLIHKGGPKYELYDLAKDPGETNDLASDAELMKDARAALQAKKNRLKEFYVKADEPPY